MVMRLYCGREPWISRCWPHRSWCWWAGLAKLLPA